MKKSAERALEAAEKLENADASRTKVRSADQK
jgi:hypothetical protein